MPKAKHWKLKAKMECTTLSLPSGAVQTHTLRPQTLLLDFDAVVDWFIDDADDPYDESDYNGMDELSPEEMCERISWEQEPGESKPWVDAVVEIDV